MDLFKRFPEDQLFANLSLYEPYTQNTKDLSPRAFPGRAVYIVTDQHIPHETISSMGATVVSSLDGLSYEEVRAGVFYLYFGCDSDSLPTLRRIKECGGAYVPHPNFDKTSYRFVNRKANDALKATWALEERVSHLNTSIHENICEALEITSHLEGDYVEIGVFRGGSALTALNYLEQLKKGGGAPARRAWLLDTFEGFNYEQARKSSDALWSDTHKLYGRNETMAHLRETFAHLSVQNELVVNNICQDDLPEAIKCISVANIDVDMYEPTLAAYTKVSPLVQVGGIIIAEDPTSTPGLYGAFMTMEEFLGTEEGRRYYKLFKSGQYFLIKMR
ncbi:TylF/MycF family methyltransferase [Cupriavidus sp. DB3]|uniref:TylF/MycF family methyltransferase n=1 Tax=Cupriavidus sp. DB3 TaxID=2873259 RepID=UPI001CF565FE|nr:TylF/MycF family methyltransferase [Cupriavidus sp. DB3]MCA7083378.1 TylF/MycF family methyltransferase [Cupriavidus sp. DB3]